MLDQQKAALQAQMAQLETLRDKITQTAESAVTAQNTSFLEGRSATSFTQQGAIAIATHVVTPGAAHGENVTSLNMYTAAEIQTEADALLDQILMPATRIGSNNYLPPNVSSGQQAVNNTTLIGAPALIEADGTLVVAPPMTNGETIKQYLAYWPNAHEFINNTAAIPDPIFTNEFLEMPDGFDIKLTSSGTDDAFVAVSYNSVANRDDLYLVLTNGSFKKGNQHFLKIQASAGYLAALIGDETVEPELVQTITARVYSVGGVKKVLVCVDQLSTAMPNLKAVNIYTADVPASSATTITLNLLTDWNVTRSDGTTATQTNLLPTEFHSKPLSAPAAERALAAVVYDDATVSQLAANNYHECFFFQNPSNENEFMWVRIAWSQFNRIGSGASNYYFCNAYRINLATKTLTDAYVNNPITVNVVNSELTFNDNRIVTGSAYGTLYHTNRGGTTIELGTKLISIRGQQFNFPYDIMVVEIPAGRGTSWYQYFNSSSHLDFPVIARTKAIMPAGKGPIANNLSNILPISDTFSAVTSAGFDVNGNLSDGFSGTFAYARHNDGVRSSTLPSLYNGKLLDVPQALTPRHRPSYSVVEQSDLACIGSFRSGNSQAQALGCSFYDGSPLSIPRRLTVNAATAERTDDGARVVMDATAWSNIQQFVVTNVHSLYPGFRQCVKEVYVPGAFNQTVPGLMVVHVIDATGIYRVLSFKCTFTYQTVGPNLLISAASIVTAPFDNRVGHPNISNVPNPLFTDLSRKLVGGCSVLQEYIHSGSSYWYLGWNSRITVSQTNSSGMARICYRLVGNDWTIQFTSFGHAWSGPTRFYSDKQFGLCRLVGERNALSDYGSKLIGIPIFLTTAAAAAGTPANSDYNTASFAVFTVKPPASFDLVLPDATPVTINGATVNLPAITTSIFTGVSSPSPSGRIHVYIKVNKEGEPSLAFSKTVVVDSLSSIYFGYVDYTTEGITDVRLFKVTKLGNFRITEGGSPDAALNVLEIARTEGLPYP